MNKIKINKKLLIGIIGGILIIIILISLSSEKKTICTLKSDQSKNGYILEKKYIIKSKNNIVKKIKIIETIKSSKKDIISKYTDNFKRQNSYNKKAYGGYKYNVYSSRGKVTSKVNINYKKFDMKKFIKNNVAMKQYTKNNKLTLDGVKSLYESSGAVCK